MGNLRPLKPSEFVNVLGRCGFIQIRQRGSHVILRHSDGRWATVPVHKGKDLTKGLIHKILTDARLTWSDIEKFL